MDSLGLPLLIYYLAVIAVFCLYGLHRYWMLWLFLRTGGLKRTESPASPPVAETRSARPALDAGSLFFGSSSGVGKSPEIFILT